MATTIFPQLAAFVGVDPVGIIACIAGWNVKEVVKTGVGEHDISLDDGIGIQEACILVSLGANFPGGIAYQATCDPLVYHVTTYDSTGVAVDAEFQFAVFRNPPGVGVPPYTP